MPSAVSLARWTLSPALVGITLVAGVAMASEAVGVTDLDVPDASRIELERMLELHRAIPVELRDADQTAVNRKPAVEGPPVYSASSNEPAVNEGTGTSENDSAASEDSISDSPVEAARPN